MTADVLTAGSTGGEGSTSGAYDPDGPFEDLVNADADVYAPQGIATRIEGGRVTVERAEQPIVVPFRVEDAGGSAPPAHSSCRRPTSACRSSTPTP